MRRLQIRLCFGVIISCMKKLRAIFLSLIFFALFSQVFAQTNQPVALVMTADGAIMPPMLEYFKRGIETANRRNAEVLIIKLNTPGGSIDTMSDMIAAISESAVPVVIYVAPQSAQAASAGALITMAGHASAMAPRTVIGASSPIDNSGANIQSTLERKIKNDLKAKARAMVDRRGADAVTLAEAMIDDAKAVTADEALKAKLIDFTATDTQDLLAHLDGFKVEVNGETRTLHTKNINVEPLDMSFIETFALTLVDANLAFMLLTVGAIAILVEISAPGGWVSGFFGAVCVTLAVYAMGILPVNWFGIVFLIIAFALFILDIKAAAHGALTAAGVASFIVGALVLFNSPGTPQFQRVSVPLVIGASIFFGLIFFTVMVFALRAQHGRIQTGAESLIAKTGIARSFDKGAGQVQLESELWSAEKSAESESIRKGDLVEVVEVRGLRLIVKKK